jgi:hypothetical protein
VSSHRGHRSTRAAAQCPDCRPSCHDRARCWRRACRREPPAAPAAAATPCGRARRRGTSPTTLRAAASDSQETMARSGETLTTKKPRWGKPGFRNRTIRVGGTSVIVLRNPTPHIKDGAAWAAPLALTVALSLAAADQTEA